METFGNDIEIQQGEAFNMDVLLSASNQEYIPFIVSSERENPHFVVTVASTKYEKNMRYVDSWWNDPQGREEGEALPTFFQTTPFKVKEAYATLSDAPSNKSELEAINPDESAEHRYLYQFTCDDEEVEEETGHKPYHYMYIDYKTGAIVKDYYEEVQGEKVLRVAYECHVRQNFLTDITRLWGAQNYMYQITLVHGKELQEVLLAAWSQNGYPEDFPIARDEEGVPLEEQPTDYIKAQYKYVKKQWPGYLQPDIDDDSPLGIIDTPEVIVPPSKLTVNNNLRQMI